MIDKDLLGLLGKRKKYLFSAVLAMLTGLLANVAVTASICYAIYLLSVGAEPTSYVLPAATACLAIALRYASSRIGADLRDMIGREAKRDIRKRIYDKISSLGTSISDSSSVAGLTQVAIEGVEQLDLYYSSYIPQFFYAMLAPLLLFCITVGVDARVALTLLICVPLIPISIIAVSKYAKRIFAKYWGRYTSMGDGFLDSIEGLRDLKIFDFDKAQHKEMNDNAEEFRRITMKVLVMQLASTTIMDLVAYGGAGVGIAIAISGARQGRLDPISALFLILVAVEFFLPLRAFGSAFHIAMNGASAGRRIIKLLETEDPKWGDGYTDSTSLSLRNVTFSYDGEHDVLRDLSIDFPSTGLSAIVGESGCGKSTVVGLLCGSSRARLGDVLIGERDIFSLSRASYYSKLAVVSYNTYIFNVSVRENFRLAVPDVSDSEIYAALEAVNLKDFIAQNGGLDKMISDGAQNISGGQKQRLALAIALVANKDIYIFDEATSNIDIESEAIIMNNIKKLAERKSVIVISHRLANTRDADMIYYMESGEIRERGDHAALMQLAGGYARLYNTQSDLEMGYKTRREA